MSLYQITKLLLSNNNVDRQIGLEMLKGLAHSDDLFRINRYLWEKKAEITIFDPKIAGLVYPSNNKHLAAIGYFGADGNACYKYIER